MGASSSRCAANSVQKVRLEGKTAVITGANTGIGRECSKDFYIRGAKVIMACRSMEKVEQAINTIKDECKDVENLGSLEPATLDLSSLQSVRECADKIIASNDGIDILLNNAGVMMCPEMKTKEGFEMQFGTNHLGHFLFTLLLMPKLMSSKAKPARIITVSSTAHKQGTLNFEDLNYEKRTYSPLRAYAQSKLANILFSNELTRRIKDAGLENAIHTYCLHPGVIKTDLGRHLDETMFKGFRFLISPITAVVFKTPEQGAKTSIYCSVSEEAGKETGLYYSGSQVASTAANAKSAEDAEKLWAESLKMCGLGPDFDPFKKSP